MKIWILKIAATFSLVAFVQPADGRDRLIDPRLEKALSDFAEYNKLRFDRGDADRRSIREKLEKLTQLEVSSCELLSELVANQPGNPERVGYVLSDLVEEKLRQVDLTQEIILRKLRSQRSVRDEQMILVRRLAVQIAAQSSSITELRESIIPKVFSGIEAKLERLSTLEDKLDALDLQRRREIDSICDRLDRLEEANRSRGENDYRTQRPLLEDSGESILDRPTPRVVPMPTETFGSGGSVTSTDWEPDGYTFNVDLCPTARLQFKNVYFDCGLIVNGVSRPVRVFGDIWTNCDGRVIMDVIREVYRD